jgi:carboxymethylenebutenolidase
MSTVTTQRTDSIACGETANMDLHVWTPDGPGTASILLIQEIFGVSTYIRAVAERLAAAGYVVGAPDVFWRFHPHWAADHDEAGLNASFGMVQQLDVPLAIADCAAALAHLGSSAFGDQGVVRRAPGVLGFCLGGTLAWGVAAAAEPSVCVSYYGSGVPDMLGMIDDVHCPTLLHFGNTDAFIATEGVDRIGAAIAGRQGFVLNIENAGHAFDNHESEMFHDESAAKAAWAKTMAFLGLYLPA